MDQVPVPIKILQTNIKKLCCHVSTSKLCDVFDSYDIDESNKTAEHEVRQCTQDSKQYQVGSGRDMPAWKDFKKLLLKQGSFDSFFYVYFCPAIFIPSSKMIRDH